MEPESICIITQDGKYTEIHASSIEDVRQHADALIDGVCSMLKIPAHCVGSWAWTITPSDLKSAKYNICGHRIQNDE